MSMLTIVKTAAPEQDGIGEERSQLSKDQYLRKKADNFAAYVRTVATDTAMIDQFSAMTTAQLMDFFITNVLPYSSTLSVPTARIIFECGISALDLTAYDKVKRYLNLFVDLIDA
jgi:hypothetical protein